MRRAMNRTVGDKTHESARYGSFLTVERPSRKGFDRLGLILIRQALEGRLPLFTQLPRRLIPGNWASGIRGSRKSTVVLCSAVRTARSVSYTGLSSQEEGLPFVCLLGNPVRKRQDTSTQLKLAQWALCRAYGSENR